MFVMNLDSHQRGVYFRLGRVVGVVGHGLVIVLPVLDRVHKVDLNALLPSWRGLGRDEIARLVIDHVLNSPGTEEGVSEETPGAVALALTLVGLVVSLHVVVGPLPKRRRVKRQLEDMRIMRKDMARKHGLGEKEC